jgi:uncharacterized membrane protein YhaH (DUF805 family)
MINIVVFLLTIGMLALQVYGASHGSTAGIVASVVLAACVVVQIAIMVKRFG